MAIGNGRVEGWPIGEVNGIEMEPIERAVMSFGAERDNEIERRIFEIVEQFWCMGSDIEAEFIHHGDGKGVGLAESNTGRVDVDLLEKGRSKHSLSHRGTQRIMSADEQDRFCH